MFVERWASSARPDTCARKCSRLPTISWRSWWTRARAGAPWQTKRVRGTRSSARWPSRAASVSWDMKTAALTATKPRKASPMRSPKEGRTRGAVTTASTAISCVCAFQKGSARFPAWSPGWVQMTPELHRRATTALKGNDSASARWNASRRTTGATLLMKRWSVMAPISGVTQTSTAYVKTRIVPAPPFPLVWSLPSRKKQVWNLERYNSNVSPLRKDNGSVLR